MKSGRWRGRPNWSAPRRVQAEWWRRRRARRQEFRRVVWGYRLRVLLGRPYPRTVDREEFRRRYGV